MPHESREVQVCLCSPDAGQGHHCSHMSALAGARAPGSPYSMHSPGMHTSQQGAITNPQRSLNPAAVLGRTIRRIASCWRVAAVVSGAHWIMCALRGTTPFISAFACYAPPASSWLNSVDAPYARELRLERCTACGGSPDSRPEGAIWAVCLAVARAYTQTLLGMTGRYVA